MSHSQSFIPIRIAVLTVSDTRNEQTDTSGQALVERLTSMGHALAEKLILPDNVYKVRAAVARWIAEDDVQCVLVTGGTGLTGRDVTPEAVRPLFDKDIEGFGELFRQVSFKDVGTSTVQSRAIAGLANGTLVFCMPGSTRACRTAWDEILKDQLDSRYQPCNFIGLLPRFKEK